MFKGPIFLGTIRTSFVLGLRLIVQASTLLLLATTLGPDGFGLYAGLGAMAVMLGTLASFGTHLTLLRDVSRAPLYAGGALRLALGTTTICGSILLVIYIFISPVLLQTPDGTYWVILCLGSADVFLQPFLAIAVMERHGRGQVARSQILLILPLFLRLLTVLVVAACAPDNPLIWYALGHLIAVMLPLGYVIWLAPVVWHQPSQWRVARSHEWGELAGYAVMNASANGVAELDKMLAIRLLPYGMAGVYSVASRVVGSLVLPVIAMMLAAMPRLFRNGAVEGRSLQYWLFTSAGIYGLLAAVLIAFASPWIEALLGESYAGAGNLISLLAYAVPAISVRAAATNVLTTLERPWVRIFLELFGWLVIVVLALVFVRSRGGQGLAISIIYAEWILAAGSVFLISIISASSDKAEGEIKSR